MPLNLTKIAFGAQSFDDIESWYAGRRSPHLTTKYRPTKWEQCIGGSLYWIHQHNLVARSKITGFSQTDSGRWLIELEPKLIRVHPQPKRAHQGWRYLKASDAPADLPSGAQDEDALPPELSKALAAIGVR